MDALAMGQMTRVAGCWEIISEPSSSFRQMFLEKYLGHGRLPPKLDGGFVSFSDDGCGEPSGRSEHSSSHRALLNLLEPDPRDKAGER